MTHRGVSGPAALKLSAFAAVELAEAGYAGALKLNLLPALSGTGVVSALEAFKVDGRRKLVRNANPFGLPGRLWEAVACGGGDEAEATGAKRWGELRRAEVEALSSRLTATPLPFAGKDSNKDEFVTCGGVDWRDVAATQMQSRLVSGLVVLEAHVPRCNPPDSAVFAVSLVFTRRSERARRETVLSRPQGTVLVHRRLFFAGEVLDVDGVTGGFNFQAAWTTGYTAGQAAAAAVAVAAAAAPATVSE